MRYKELYWMLIIHCQNQVLGEDVYTEKHHIVPRHMGGSDDEINLVQVTYRQHVLLHRLLWKGWDSLKDRAAYLLMSKQVDYVQQRIELQRLSKLGIPWSKEMREKMAKKRIEMMQTPEWWERQRYYIAKAHKLKSENSELRSKAIIDNAERNMEWLHKVSSRAKYKFISPEGLVFNSPIFAAKYYGKDVKPLDIENWCKRKKYGWNTYPELAKT